jgi:hypothetical protein
VNKNATIQKQVTAFFLLAVFLFIHAAKVLHSHESNAASCQEWNATTLLEKSSHCSICDYHFTKDAHNDVVQIVLTPKQQPSLYFISYQSRKTSSIGLNYADRGPPVIAS